MPVFAVNSDGVSFAMSFICGLSTMATLIEPPFDPPPEAGDPPEDELLEPPQPATTTPTTASTAATDPRRRVRLMDPPPPACTRGTEFHRTCGLITLVCVGCQAGSADFRRQ